MGVLEFMPKRDVDRLVTDALEVLALLLDSSFSISIPRNGTSPLSIEGGMSLSRFRAGHFTDCPEFVPIVPTGSVPRLPPRFSLELQGLQPVAFSFSWCRI